jgi:hypothetical protein
MGQGTGRCLGSLGASCSALACCSSVVHLAVWVFGASRFFLLSPGAKSRRNRGLIVNPWLPARAPRPPARVPARVLTGVIAVLGGDSEATPVPSTEGAEMIVHPTRWRAARLTACGGTLAER